MTSCNSCGYFYFMNQRRSYFFCATFSSFGMNMAHKASVCLYIVAQLTQS
eukprot:m.219311 g.219311  ORF g.219311 m.219311 type:complete len:50 (+) comp15914_c0_seq3:2170-2319(+)